MTDRSIRNQNDSGLVQIDFVIVTLSLNSLFIYGQSRDLLPGEEHTIIVKIEDHTGTLPTGGESYTIIRFINLQISNFQVRLKSSPIKNMNNL